MRYMHLITLPSGDTLYAFALYEGARVQGEHRCSHDVNLVG
jgi:hypothetical protein